MNTVPSLCTTYRSSCSKHFNKKIKILFTNTFLSIILIMMGMVESRWVPRSSKSVAGRNAGRDGFDSHPSPP